MQSPLEELKASDLIPILKCLTQSIRQGTHYSETISKISSTSSPQSHSLIQFAQMLQKFPRTWAQLFLNQQIHCPTRTVQLGNYMYVYFQKLQSLSFGCITFRKLMEQAKTQTEVFVQTVTKKLVESFFRCKQALLQQVSELNLWADKVQYSNKYIMFKVIKELSSQCNSSIKQILRPLFHPLDKQELESFSKWVIEKHEIVQLKFEKDPFEWVTSRQAESEQEFQQKLTNYLKSLKSREEDLLFSEALRQDGKKGLLITEIKDKGLDQKYLIFSDDSGMFTVMNCVFITHRWKARNFSSEFGGINIKSQNKIDSILHEKEDVVSQMRTAPTSIANLNLEGIQNVGDSLGKCLANFENYSSINSFVRDFTKKTAIAGSISYLVLKIPALGGLMIVGGFSYSLYNIFTCDYKNNKHKFEDIGKITLKTSASIGGGLIGAAVGQAILPIPFVGMFVGGVIGGFLSTIGSSKAFQFLKNKNQEKIYAQLKKRIRSDGSWQDNQNMLALFGMKKQYFRKSVPNDLSQEQHKDVWISAFCFCVLSYFQSKKDQMQMQKELGNNTSEDSLVQKLGKIKQSGQKNEFVSDELEKSIAYLEHNNFNLKEHLQALTEIMVKILEW